MPSSHPRLAVMLVLAFLTATIPTQAAQQLPVYAGKWKILVPHQQYEVAMWIVQINAKGNEVKLLSGVSRYKNTKIPRANYHDGLLSMLLVSDDATCQVAVRTKPGVNRRLPGSIRIGSTILPAWLEPTDQATIDEKKSTRPASGLGELQKAEKLKDTAARHKAFRTIAATYANELTPFLVQQTILAELLDDRSTAQALAKVIADYRTIAALHGDELLIGTNLDLARNLLRYPPAAELAADFAQAAIKLFRDDHPIEMQLTAHLTLAASLAALKKQEETRPVAKALDKLGELYVKQMSAGEKGKPEAALRIAQALSVSPATPVSEVGLGYARMVVKDIKSDTPPALRAAAYRVQLRGLQKHGKPAEITRTQSLLEFTEKLLDDEFRKVAIPFTVPTISPQKDSGKGRRTAVVELFTTGEDPACRAADGAFEAAHKAYPPGEVVFLRYHVHVNDPDVLTSPTALARREFYAKRLDRAVPGIVVNGENAGNVGGAPHRAKTDFETLRKSIDAQRQKAPEATLDLQGSATQGKFTIKATVGGLLKPGPGVRLHFFVVEKEVRHEGANGRRLHGNLVRGILGEEAGIALKTKDSTHTVILDVATLRKSLDGYLSDFEERFAYRWDERRLDLKDLVVVAVIQDEATKNVYQAKRVTVPNNE